MADQRAATDASWLGALTSRLGRRFVALFALCALLPLVVFAALAVDRVSRQMHAELRQILHNAAKTAGMGIAARLSQVAGDLALVAELAQSWRAEGAWSDGEALQAHVGDRCAGVWLFEAGAARTLCGAGEAPRLRLGAEEREHLAGGKPLVQIVGDPGELVMVMALDPTQGTDAVVVAQIRRRWFWDPEELRGAGCDFAACDLDGRVLFHTFRETPETRALLVERVEQPSSGTFEWRIDGEPHLARYWHAFLQPRYMLDLVVVQSRSQAEAEAVVAEFVRWFWLTAACTLLVVVLGGLVQMRRTLQPILSLRDATGRLGRGELDARVAVTGRDEFAALGHAFNDMAGALQENISRREQTERELVASRDAALAAAKAKAEFVTNVSHEFRTPMAEILGAAEILTQLGDEDDAAREEFSGIALHGAQRLARMLDDVLELGKLSDRPVDEVDVAATLRAAVRGLDVAEEKRVRLLLDDELPMLSGNEAQLTDTWSRLLDNAIKFGPVDAPIEVRARRLGDHLVVDVVDRGPGVAPEDRERVFEPFCQVGRDQLIDKAGGTGLGLTLAKSAVEGHGGTIEVLGQPGEGATLRVSLPLQVPAHVGG